MMRDLEDCSTDDQVEETDKKKPMTLGALRAQLNHLQLEHKETKEDIKTLSTAMEVPKSLANARAALAELQQEHTQSKREI